MLTSNVEETSNPQDNGGKACSSTSEDPDNEGWILVTHRRRGKKSPPKDKQAPRRSKMVKQPFRKVMPKVMSRKIKEVQSKGDQGNDEGQSPRKKGKKPFLCTKENNDLIEGLKNLTLPLTSLEESKFTKSPLKGFVRPTKGPLVKHDDFPSQRANGFDPNAYKLLIRAGYKQEEVSKLVHKPSEPTKETSQNLSKNRKAWQKKTNVVKATKSGFGFAPLKLKIHKETSRYIMTEEVDDEEDTPVESSRLSVFNRLGTTTTRTSIFDRLNMPSNQETLRLDLKVAVHHLAVKKGVRPIKQAQRCLHPNLIPQIEAEVNKLIEAGFIRGVKYPTWISNIVLVRKKNGQIRVYVDFRDLNYACSKDDFPLPLTEIMVDATTGHEALSFMDGSSGYNQIRMDPKDEELTTFRTPKGIYCYKVMPFGLKNAGATYQRAMQKIFDDMLHRNVECYADDLVVKSKKRVDHLEDLHQVFERLRRYQLRMNPLKCAFGVSLGKFLGFIVCHRGIEIDQSKIDAIIKMPEPSNLHELKSFQGRLVYIRRFISNLAVLRAPIPGRPLILYIVAQERFLGALLAQQNDEGKESALYYLSRILNDPLKYLMSKLVLSGRLAKWALLLQEFDITYIPQKAVKGQALSDFLADYLIPDDWKFSEDLPDEDVLYIEIPKPWKLYFDGAARQDGVGAGVIFITPEGEVLPYAFTLIKNYSNNMAEYQALIISLEMAVDMQITQLKVFGDSKLVINQVFTLYEVKKPELLPYVNYVKKLLKWFDKASMEHVLRKENRQADSLANLASVIASPNTELKVHLCKRWIIPPITLGEEVDIESNVVSVLEGGKEDWQQSLIDYLEHGKLPNDSRHKTKIKHRALRSIYFKGTHYRRSFDRVFLRCLGDEEAYKALQEAHSGICGAHQSGAKLHFQIKRMGYYWPTMVKDSMDYAKRCQACQFHANFIHQPSKPLHPTVTSWPFDAWGLDLVGPLPKSSTGHLYILAATNNFSKWVEAASYREVKKETVATFIRTNIIYRSAVLPLERQIPSLRIAIQEGLSNEDNVRLRLEELEALDEKTLEAHQRLECYQARLSKAFNKKVKP
ncbi:PREDICTED: uncharacterized protein LOC108661358 [Theobroma cacao]|uniref:Uncharacterized protein LOC108661358 n=1 Tax=Theobroma cacao TaxID=3641 RepID=A0AB32W4H0_THECC|nr:PREDICTED: uncharacterized protein LOC108661358 [Theobroma cacao]